MRCLRVCLAVLSFSSLACGGGTEDAPTPSGDPDARDAASEDVSSDASTDTLADAADAPSCPSPVVDDPLRTERSACKFAKGAKVAETLGITPSERAAIPIKRLVIVMQENRSFDHYFGRLHLQGQPDAEGFPESFSNPDRSGVAVKPFHLKSTCLPDDAPHQWTAMRSSWNAGKMDGFVTTAASTTSDGHYVMGYYDQTDLPFYYWLANTWAIADRNFTSVLAGTWPNRDYLYAATSDGVTYTGERAIAVPTVFDALDKAKVTWGVFTDGTPRQDSLGWKKGDPGTASYAAFLAKAKDGTLPQVSFVDPSGTQDEHPPNDVQKGEAWSRSLYLAALNSPQWSELAVIFTYDESGGLFEHVPPPKGCIAAAGQEKFDRQGFRVPLIVVSPYARRHFVSHASHETTSITRLVELLFDLPAMTARDANSDALLDMFDFSCAPPPKPESPKAAGVGGCP